MVSDNMLLLLSHISIGQTRDFSAIYCRKTNTFAMIFFINFRISCQKMLAALHFLQQKHNYIDLTVGTLVLLLCLKIYNTESL